MKQMFHSETPRSVGIIFTELCKEREGNIVRAVYHMPRTLESVLDVVENMQAVPNFLPRGSVSPLTNENNITLCVDDVGVMVVIPFDAETAHAHITFWDGRLRGREQLCHRAACYILATTPYSLMTAIPLDRPVVRAFAKRVGFSEVYRDSKAAILWFVATQGVQNGR